MPRAPRRRALRADRVALRGERTRGRLSAQRRRRLRAGLARASRGPIGRSAANRPFGIAKLEPRLRPDRVVESDEREGAWVGRVLRIGGMAMRVDQRDDRCRQIRTLLCERRSGRRGSQHELVVDGLRLVDRVPGEQRIQRGANRPDVGLDVHRVPAAARLLRRDRAAGPRPTDEIAGSPSLALEYGTAQARLGRPIEGLRWLDHALEQARQRGELTVERRALNARGAAALVSGRVDEAADYFTQALQAASRDGDVATPARRSNNLGLISNLPGRHAEAIGSCESAVARFRAAGRGEAG